MSLTDLAAAFESRFGRPPTYLSRAPGRVNLIGEHIDYNHLPVLPMAIQREVRIALRPRTDGRIRLSNRRSEFVEVDFEISPSIPPDRQGSWGNYVKAPAEELAARHEVWRGFDGLMESDVPVASGLSSSSALVSAVGLALTRLAHLDLDVLALAEHMAVAERYTGTRGGGMDQAISLAGRAGHAARIDFAPLRLRHVMIPADWRFVVADTGIRAEKSGAAQTAYNARRAECAEALEILGEALVRDGTVDTHPPGYPWLVSELEGADRALDAAERVMRGKHLKRVRHVLSEAHRVHKARDAFLMADISGFGDLMNASHASLRTDYLVSCPELDDLVTAAVEGGAAGARLTGAGLGGCIVALANAGTVADVLEILRESSPRQARKLPREDRVFFARPSDGASFGPFPG